MKNNPNNSLINEASFVDLLSNYIEQYNQLEKYFSGENSVLVPENLSAIKELLNKKILAELQLYYSNNLKKFSFKKSIVENYKSIEEQILQIKNKKNLEINAQHYEMAAIFRDKEKHLLSSIEIKPIIDCLNNNISEKLANSNDAQSYFGNGITVINILEKYYANKYDVLLSQHHFIAVKLFLSEVSLKLNFCTQEEYDYAMHMIDKKKSKWLKSILIK